MKRTAVAGGVLVGFAVPVAAGSGVWVAVGSGVWVAVGGSAVLVAGGGSAVLVAVDATVRNVKAPDGRPSHYRIQVDVARDPDSGAWLVSRLQFVG